METSSESSSGGVLLVDEQLTQLSTNTDNINHRKRLPCPLIQSETTKRRRLEDDDMETSSRESRWSQYRNCTHNFSSTLTEQSDDNNTDELEGCNLHVAAHQVPDLEEHIEKLAMELQEWSLVNLKEWRHQQFGDTTTTIPITNGCSPPTKQQQPPGRRSKEAVKKQKAAKRKLMRALRHHETGMSDTMEE